MAKNGSGRVPSNWNSNYGLFVEWNASQNVVGNYSDITVVVYADLLGPATISVGARSDGKIIIANQEATVDMPAVSKMYNGDAKIKLASITKRVYHRDDGSLQNVTIKAVWPIRATISGVYRATIEGAFNTGEIDRIPRASEIISSVDFTLENDLTVNLKRYSDDFKHNVVLKINNSTFKTVTNVDTTTTFTFDNTDISNLYTASINSSSLPVEIEVTTKLEDDTIGTSKKEGKMYIDPIKNAPTFTNFEFKPDDAGTETSTGWDDYIDEDNELSILGHTIYTIKPGTATAKNGASITGYEVSLNNKIYRGTGSEFTLPNPILYNDNLIVYAVDSRGFKTPVIKQIRGQQYEKISFTTLDVKRNSGTPTQLNFNIAGKIFKNSDVANQLSAQYRSREVGGSFGSWVNITSNFTVGSNGEFLANFNQTAFDTTKTYELEIQISDLFTSETFQIFINKVIPVVNVSKEGKLSVGEIYIYDGEEKIPLIVWEDD